MTDEMMNLRALVERTPDAEMLQEMIRFAAKRQTALKVPSSSMMASTIITLAHCDAVRRGHPRHHQSRATSPSP
jgi:hypothetical protein